jgi:hypothetical protein
MADTENMTMMTLQPAEESVSVSPEYEWDIPLKNVGEATKQIRSVWYVGLPLTSAHRGSHSGGGALIEGVGGQERYLNEGTVYPHASLVEMITYHQRCFPTIPWKYFDMSHIKWAEIRELIRDDPPDVAAFSVYTATALWAMIVAAEIKRVNPRAIIVFGNDHAGILHNEILTGKYGSKIVDFVSTGNNGPYSMMGLLYVLQGELDITRVPYHRRWLVARYIPARVVRALRGLCRRAAVAAAGIADSICGLCCVAA